MGAPSLRSKGGQARIREVESRRAREPSAILRRSRFALRHLQLLWTPKTPYPCAARSVPRSTRTDEQQMRTRYEFVVVGYVVMPEHFHLLISEPECDTVSTVMQALKQSVSKRAGSGLQFWERRFYDFNVFTERKRIEKLRYMHRNPVKRGLCAQPEDWPWSSFRHYRFGEERAVKVDTGWKVIVLQKRRALPPRRHSHPCLARMGHPSRRVARRIELPLRLGVLVFFLSFTPFHTCIFAISPL
jgi:REP element-mobilizing transposase RayT